MGEILKGADPLLYVRQGNPIEAPDTELLDRIRAHSRPVHHGPAHVVLRHRSGTCQIRHEAAGKGIAGAGGIKHVFQRVRRDVEGAAGLDQESTVLPLLDHHSLRTMSQNPAACPVDIPITTQLSRLAVIDHQDIDPGEELEESSLFALDPVIHGVAHDQLGLLDLFQNPELQLGIDVAEEEEAS